MYIELNIKAIVMILYKTNDINHSAAYIVNIFSRSHEILHSLLPSSLPII